MPTRAIEIGTAGPAYNAAAWPVSTKIPAPMTAPTPSVTRLKGPRVRLRDLSPVASASARSAVMDLVAQRDMTGIPGRWCPESAGDDETSNRLRGGREDRGAGRDLRRTDGVFPRTIRAAVPHTNIG